MKEICIDDLQVGDVYTLWDTGNGYKREVKQILTGQTHCDKQLLCLVDDGHKTYHTVQDCLGMKVYLVGNILKLNQLKVGDHFRWYEGDKILKIVTEKLDDHLVYMYTAFGTTYYSVYCEAEPTWNDEVILEDEETN